MYFKYESRINRYLMRLSYLYSIAYEQKLLAYAPRTFTVLFFYSRLCRHGSLELQLQ